MLTGVCLIVIKVIYTQNIPTHVREWPSILLHVVLMSINICLRALYIMDNNVGALQTIPLGGATQNSTGENRAEHLRPEWLSFYWGQQTLISSAMQMRSEPAHSQAENRKFPWGWGHVKRESRAWVCSEGRFNGQGTYSWTVMLSMPRKDSHADGLGDFDQVI